MRLREDGHYVLEVPGVDLHEQLFYKIAFSFGPNRAVTKFHSEYLQAAELERVSPSKYSVGWDGQYMVVGYGAISFTVVENGWESVWTGLIQKGAIEFEIQDEDFLDISGNYPFVPCVKSD